MLTTIPGLAPYEEIGSLGDLLGPDRLTLLDGQLVNIEAELQNSASAGRGEKKGRKEMGDGRGLRVCMVS